MLERLLVDKTVFLEDNLVNCVRDLGVFAFFVLGVIVGINVV